MNTIVENIRFNTGDYWGSKHGFKFRTSVDGFGHTTELQVGDDRIVKTEFDLITHGYILPETITTLENQRLTTEKFFTPKKMIVNSEVVASDYDLTKFDANREKWRNQNYPNLPKDEVIPPPGVAITEPTDNSSIAGQIVSTLKYTTAATPPQIVSDTISNVTPYLKVVPPPPDIGGSGTDGDVAYDDQYIYIYAGTRWRRVAISQFE
jgi:hypothetical protein